MYEFKLPDLGEGIHEAEILQWYVSAGDTIEEDANLVNLETDKAAVTIPAPRGGTVVDVVGAPGDIVHVGDVIARIDDGAEQQQPSSKEPQTESKSEPQPEAQPATKTAAPSSAASASAPASNTTAPASKKRSGPVPAAPATRRLARELGIDINLVEATGPAGRVTVDDVKRHQASGSTAPAQAQQQQQPTEHLTAPKVVDEAALAEFAAHAASTIPFLDIQPLPEFEQFGPVEREPLRSIRRKVAHKMVTSMILVPHVAHMDEADVTELENFRKSQQEKRAGEPGGHLTLLSFVVRAVVAGLKAAPSFNASLDPFKQQIVYKKYYNIGIAVDSGAGLLVPVIKGADGKSIMQISTAIEDLANRARGDGITVDDLRGGTFTITNVGPLGGTAMIPTINYPEVAILGMGKVQEKPVVRNGEIVIRKILPITLAFDHRIADGADAARFVSELIRLLSDPSLMMLET